MNLGDLTLNIILNISDADGKAKQLTASLKDVDTQFARTEAQSVTLSSKLQNVGLSFQGLFAVWQIGKSTLGEFLSKYNEFQSALIGLNSIATFKGIDPQVTKNTISELDLVKSGMLSVADASTSLKNLLSANFSLEQSVNILKRFGDAAAFGRQSSLSFGEAIRSGTEGIKNGNSILVDNTGVTKNLSVMLVEAGLSAQSMGNAASDSAVRQAIYNGIMRETLGQVGDANKLMNTSAGDAARYQKSFNDFQISIGKLFASLSVVLVPLSHFMEYLSKAPDNVKVAIVAIMALVAAMYLFQGSIPHTVKVFALLSSLIIALPAPMRVVVSTIAILIAAMIALNGQISILNISLGGAPVIIGLLVTGLLGLSSAFGGVVGSFSDFQKLSESQKTIDDYSTSIDKMKTDVASLELIQNRSREATVLNADEQKTYEATLARVSAQYPAILSQVDEYTGKLTLNKDALEKIVKAEKDRLALAESNRANNQVIQINTILDTYTDLEKEIQKLQFQEESLTQTMQLASNEAESLGAGIDDTRAQKKLLNIQSQVGELGNQTNELKTSFIKTIEEAYKFGNLESVINRLKSVLNETSQGAKFFFDVISQYTGQAVQQWDQVTAAIERMKNSIPDVISAENQYPKEFNKMTRNELSQSKSEYEKKLKDVTPGTEDETYFKQQIKLYDDRLKQLDGVNKVSPRGSTKSSKEEKDAVEELIKTYEKALEIYYTTDDVKTKFTTAGKSLIDVYSDINRELRENNTLTEDQVINLVKYRDKILDLMQDNGINFNKLFTAGFDDDIEKMAQQFADERMKWYELYGSKDKRFKPLDQTKEYLDALKILEEINGNHLKQNDYINFANNLREKANTLDASDYKTAQRKLDILKQAEDYEQKALSLYKQRISFETESQKLKISLLQNEYDVKRQNIQNEYNLEITKLQQLSEAEKNNIGRNNIDNRINLLTQQRNKALQDLEDERINNNLSKFSTISSEVQNISTTLNLGANTFIAKLINGFHTVLTLAESLKNILSLTGIIKSIAAISTFGAAATIPVPAGLPDVITPSAGAGSGFVDNIKTNLTNTFKYLGSYFTVPNPSLASASRVAPEQKLDVNFGEFKLKGEDIHGSVESYKQYLKSKRS